MEKFCRKGHPGRNGKRWLALLMSLCLMGTTLPISARAENGSQATGLCEHHTGHTTECGYVAPVEGHECGHVHDGECGYQEAGECTHVHTDACRENQESCTHVHTEACGENQESCAHTHTEECGGNQESCTHTHTEECGYAEGHSCEHIHDDKCGYVESSEGSPCTFVCDICGNEAGAKKINLSAAVLAVQALIDALPDAGDITEENFEEVSDRLGEIDTAKEALTAEESSALDVTGYDAAAAKMMELMGQAGVRRVALMSVSGFNFSLTGNNGATVKTINLNAAALRPNSTWSSGGNLVYFGTYNGNPVAYRVLSSPNTQTSSENYLLLDCDTTLQTMAFDADDTKNSGQTTYPNEWKGSDLEAWLNGAEFYAGSVFSGIEKDAIAETALAEQSGYSAGNHGDSYQDYSAQNHVFCLSAAEADGLYADHNARRKTGRKYWWLRSAHSALGSNVGVVEINGVISPTFVGNDDDVSPALNLNLSSVLLASENGMGKSSALASVSDSTATQWKLTLCDSGKTVNVTSGQNVERRDAGGSTTITVPYTYTDSNTANPVNQISVMITDKAYTESDAQILYYGALQGVTISNPAATGTFTLPANLANQTCGTDYYAYIIAEDVNGEKETDYASAPAAITIPAASGSNPVTPDTPAASVKGKGLGVSIIADPTAPAATTDAWKGSYVYFGTYNSNPVKYRVLDRTTTDFGGTTMLLDCDSILWKGDNPSSKFDDSSNVWSSSYIKKYLNSESPYESTGFLSGSFTNLEQTAIAASSKASPSTTDGNGVSNLNYAALSNDKIFLLDAKEVTNTSYGYSITITPDANRRKPGTSNAEWWLRSAEGAGAALTSTGLVAAGGHFDFLWVGDDDIGVSPAFNLNLPSVLFSSVLSGTSGQPGAEYKLTLQDNEMTITAGTITRDSGDGITVPYTIGGTNGGNATQVSLMVLDKEYTAGNTNGARLVAYEKLADAGNTRGTFTLTSDMKNGSYYYYIVAEDVNGGNATDYASAPQPITIPSLKYTITITNGTLSGGSTTGDYAQGETVTITADAAPDGQQFKEWTVESGSITLADSTSATTTFTMPAEAVSVKANYEKIITSVEVNISQPTPGNNLAGTAAVSTPGVKTASPDITWKEGSKTAGPTAGYHAAYTAEVTLSPDTDYVFASQVTANIKADGTTVGSGTVTNNASGTITISYTFAATRKANVIRIINPAAITGVANGTAKTVAALGLPGTVMMETEDGNRMADVTWDLSNLTGTYEPSVLTEQTFTADGKVTLPSDLGNGRNITLNASVQVTVSEAGVVGAVQATPPEGTYSSNQKIVLRSSTDGAEIYYTIDGSEPGRTNGTKYTEAIDVTGREGQSVQTRIKAMAVKSGMKDSGAVTFTYTIQIPASKYTVTVTGGSTTGEYAQGETVTITAGAAPEGQQFKEWVVESGNITLADSTGETTSFTMPAGEVKVRAVYEEGRNPGGGAADPGAGGTANPGGGGPAASNTPGSPATPDTTYQIINGANGSWVYGSDEGLTIRGNGEFSRFTGVRVDGGLLDQSNYTAREGSTIITLKTSYLNALAAGKHTVEILWMDGSAGTTFTINANASRDSALPGGTNKKDDVPKTGDSIPIVGLFILAGLSGAGLIFTGGKGRKNPEASGK